MYMAVSGAIYLLSWIMPRFILYFALIPEYMFFDVYIFHLFWLIPIPVIPLWMPLTCLYVNFNIIELQISWLLLWQVVRELEPRKGTAGAFYILNVCNVLIGLLLIQIYFVLRLLFGPLMIYLGGIWPLYILFLTKRCMSAPDDYSIFCCFPCPIRNLYYPLVLCVLFTQLGGSTTMWLGYIVGMICMFY